LTPIGIFSSNVDVVDALTFTSTSRVSPESLAFLVLLASAKRDHQSGNVTGLDGLNSGFEGGATALHDSATWTLLGSIACTMLFTILL